METVPCNLCGSNDYEIILKAQDLDVTQEVFNIVQCKSCSLVFTNPRPSANEISRYYQDDYYSYVIPEVIFPKKGRAIETARQIIKKCILVDYYKYRDIDPPLDEKKEHLYCSIPQQLREHIGSVLRNWLKDRPGSRSVPNYLDNGRVLDIGCGAGSTLLWFKRYGWETYGVEIGEVACQRAREQGLDIFNGDLLDAPYPDNYFDVITIYETLEHTYKPKAILKKIQQILKPGGILLGSVPNFACFERKIFKEFWYPLQIPRHLYHFSPSTLGQLLREAGFVKFNIEFGTHSLTVFNFSFNYIKKNSNKLAYLGVLSLYPLMYLAKFIKQGGILNFLAVKRVN